MFRPSLYPKQSSGGGGGSPSFSRLKPVPVGGTPFLAYTSSSTAEKAQWLSLIQGTAEEYAAVEADDVLVRTVLVGGGGSGAWSNSSGYGGFPGNVLDVLIPLSEFDDFIDIVIGAGGEYGNAGGDTSVSAQGNSSAYVGRGGLAGESSSGNVAVAHFKSVNERGFTGGNPALITGTGADRAWNQGDYPGGGGHNASSAPLKGGDACTAFPSRTVLGTNVSAANGANGAGDDIRSFGAGGSGNRTGIGGRGGIPGGGGGASNDPTTGTGGPGARGEARFQFLVST